MPSTAPLGTVSVYVSFNSIKSPPGRATVTAASFGIFSINGAGLGPGVLQDSVSATNTPVNLPSLPAQPGQVMILYGTGLGAVAADNVAPTAGTPTTKVEVFVGGQTASVGYSGRSPCCAGLDEVVFTVPSSAPLGCWVPVQIRTSGTTVSNTTTMAISADGAPCSDSANALTASFLAGKKIGLIGLLRTDVSEDVGLAKSGQVTTDAAMLTFQQENPLPAAPFNAILSLPPPGSCTGYSAAGDLFDGDPLPGADDSGAKFLNAGTPLTISSAAGQRSLGRPASNARNFQPLGYTYTGSLVPSSLFLNAGNLTLSAPGGPDVGAFQAGITVPSAFELTWTNQPSPPSILTITRSQGFTVNWSGAPPGQPVIIFGGGVDLPSNSSAVFACVAPVGSSSFTVPAIALGNIPATRRNLLKSKGVVYVGALPASNPTIFSASGLDLGAIVTGAFAGRTVIFQ